ncbi:hypothetical protein ABIB57_005354 [Devosia sp. UYZn731]|uniref:hypothetical protein n=1 Tax=Devosia sp. UYZn731 TaxID=3156345 RepID=UPI00339AFD57
MNDKNNETSEVQQPYELFTFARKHGLPLDSAREIVERFGADRAGADAAATLAKSHIRT